GIRGYKVTGVQTCALPILENVQELIAGAAAWAETAVEEGDEAGNEAGDEAGEGGRVKGATLIERYLTQAALVTSADQGTGDPTRSEERRVGKEGRARRAGG